MMMMMMDKKLSKLAQSKVRVGIPIFLNLIMAIILLILSVDQSFPINEAGDGMILGAFFTGWQRNVCLNRMMQFVSPFLFHFKINKFNLDFGLLGCPWRIRNTIYRLTLICLIVILSLWMLVILWINKGKSSSSNNNNNNAKGVHIWSLLYWVKYVLFLSMVILFILDCDGVYAGYNTCRSNFDLTGFGPLILSLLGAEFTTTSAPNWPAGSELAEGGNMAITEFAVSDHCFITPAIYVLLVDFIIICTTYLAYKLSKFHKFDQLQNYDDEEMDDHHLVIHQQKETKKGEKKKKRFKFHKTKKTTDHGENSNNNNNNNNVSSNPFDTIEEEMFEPPSWNPRKPTYEQNYS